MSYCRECGSLLIRKELQNEGMIPFCEKCNQFRFPLYNVAVSMIVINKENGKILLIQQYGKARNILVAGYVNRGEAVEDAVRRELKEEMGLTASVIHFNRTKFFEPSNTLMCNFTVYVENDRDVNVNDEIDKYDWFEPEIAREEILQGSLAAEFLNKYLDGLKEEKDYELPE